MRGRWGDPDTAAWSKAKLDFIAHVVTPKVGRDGEFVSKVMALEYIDEVMDHDASVLDELKTGLDYERLCMVKLRGAGWKAESTVATGDQGADIIATREGCRVALQCKLYGQPVGNKAVQEALSGKAFYRTDYAVVVTNAGYTKAAREASDASGVLLIHHDELSTLWDRVRRG